MKYRKLLLSYLRDGDYAHIGDEEAIELTMYPISKNIRQNLLDIGCGLGGTAKYIENNGWGKVTGIDIDNEVIHFALEQYPGIMFYQCDVENVNKLFQNMKFDILYAFNAFFCFTSQEKCLKILASVANEDATLVLFDYSTYGCYKNQNPFNNQPSTIKKCFRPIDMCTIDAMLIESGWKLKNRIDLSEKFLSWYLLFMEKMNQKKDELIYKFQEKTYYEVHESYSKLIALMEKKELGGTIIYATLKAD